MILLSLALLLLLFLWVLGRVLESACEVLEEIGDRLKGMIRSARRAPLVLPARLRDPGCVRTSTVLMAPD